jgi:hypothetical protein
MPLLVILRDSCAQDGKNSIAFTPVYGLHINSPDNNQMNGSFYGAQIAYQLNMADNPADWVRLLHVEDIAFTFSYFNLENMALTARPGSKGFLGSNFGVLTGADFSFLKLGKFDFLFFPAGGLLYATQTYYTTYNPVVGSHINLAVEAGLKAQTPIGSGTKLQAGVFFYHYSNAAFKLPNDGINSINGSLSIIQDLNSGGPVKKKIPFVIENKHFFELAIGIGRRGFIQTGQYTNHQTGEPINLTDTAAQKAAVSNLYQVGIYAGYNYHLSRIVSLKLGTDVVYYFHTFSYNNFYRTYQELGTSNDPFSVGLAVGTDVWLGRLIFAANYGYLVYYSTINPVHTYWTAGGKYYLNPWLALNAKIYIHSFEAHYVNFGLSFNVY